MRLGPGPSWLLHLSDPDDLVFALYVRDACRLTAAGDDVPHLTPDVALTLTSSVTDAAVLPAQWEAWWSALLSNRARGQSWYGTFVSEQLGGQSDSRDPTGLLPIGAELRQAQEALLRPARNWRAEHRFERRRAPRLVPHEVSLLETYLVKDIESDIGRKARPFEYHVEALPVRGRWFRDLSSSALLISEELLADTDAYRDVLRPRLTALA